MTVNYQEAGVDIAAGEEAVNRIKKHVTQTFDHNVLTGLGGFGSLYDVSFLKDMRQPVLVQSTDGVGTKLMIASMIKSYRSIGEDIVNHCCNDILCQGARPLTFLDYFAAARLDPGQLEEIVSGMAAACSLHGVSLVGGETAEMPGVYRPGEFDVAGCITGVVEKDQMITGEKIREGDVLLGLPSSGLHTNGFSLARRIFFETHGYDPRHKFAELSRGIAEELLRPHKNYLSLVLPLINHITGIVHITGGGFYGNIPRIIPVGLKAVINRSSWPVLPIFALIQRLGDVSFSEMHRVFNMGIGLILIVRPAEVTLISTAVMEQGENIYRIGEIVREEGRVQFL